MFSGDHLVDLVVWALCIFGAVRLALDIWRLIF